MTRLLWSVAAVLALAACGADPAAEDAAPTTTTTRPEVVVTTVPLPVSPYGPEETAAVLAALDEAGARELTDDGAWLDTIDVTCDFLRGVYEPSTIETYLTQWRGGIEAVGKDSLLAAEGLVAGAMVACLDVGYTLDVALHD